MEISKIIDQQHPDLLLVFAGWSASADLFKKIAIPENTDLWICSDYRTLDFAGDLKTYETIRVIGWSLGVWVAAKLFASSCIKPTSAIAINGTSCPIHDRFGIPEAIFQGTLEQLIPNGMTRFNRRMCGSRELTKRYESLTNQRPVEILYDELLSLYKAISTEPDLSDALNWDKAIVGTDDRIFPADNLQNYWNGRCTIQTIEAPHYPFSQWTNWNELWKQ